MRSKLVIISLIYTAMTVFAQTEMPDSVIVAPVQETNAQSPDSIDLYYKFDKLYSELTSSIFNKDLKEMPEAFDLTEIDTNITPGVAQIAAWRNGRVYAAGGTEVIPGLMAIDSGSLNVDHNFGNLSVNVYGSATKYAYFNGLQTTYGIGAALTYRFSDKVSATIFGEYQSGARAMQAAMAGFVATSRFGGFVDYSFSDKFGIEVGAQGYRSMMTRRIEAQPIIKPYFRLSKNAKIGVDVGGIMYQILKSHHSGYNGNNPTIGPPVQKLSQAMGY